MGTCPSGISTCKRSKSVPGYGLNISTSSCQLFAHQICSDNIRGSAVLLLRGPGSRNTPAQSDDAERHEGEDVLRGGERGSGGQFNRHFREAPGTKRQLSYGTPLGKPHPNPTLIMFEVQRHVYASSSPVMKLLLSLSLNPTVGPSRKDGLRRCTVTNLTVTVTSQIFAIGASGRARQNS